ncbi:MAG TPA: ArsR family transcriptional regulator [Microlunatus sp.]
MRTRSAALLPLLRSEVQGEVLALLLLHPDESYTVTSVANTVHRPMQSIQKEISRLVDAGILDDRKVGNMRYVQANTAGALYAPLAELMALTYGPEPVLRDLLAAMPQVQEAYIYGSWAARRTGEPGPVPVDIDVIVIGSSPTSVLDEVAERAESELHRPVNIRRVAPEDWAAAGSGFLQELQSRPLIPLRGAAW